EPTLFYALSQMHDQSGHGEEARHWLQEARSRFGDNARTWLLEAQLLQNMGRTEAAEAVLAQAVEQYPENRLARYSYAQMLVQHNKLEEAIEQFEALIRQQPGDLETVYSMVLILLELQDYNRAEPRLRQLVNAGHRLNEASYYLAVILQSRGDRLEALGHYQQISRQSNAYLASQRQIINLLIKLGRYDDAHAWGQQLIASDARLAPMVPALEAEALANAGQNERARDTLNAALEQYPDNTDLLFARTLISERFDDMEMIERDLRHILSIDPDDARALNHLGYALTIRTTRYEEGLDLIQRASALQPDDPAITDSLGWVQYKLGNYEAALENLKKAY